MSDTNIVIPGVGPILQNQHKEIINRFSHLKLKGMAQELTEQFAAPNIFNALSFEERLCKLLDTQEYVKSTAAFNAAYKRSGLQSKIDLNSFKPNPKAGLFAEDLAMLAETNYIRNSVNVIITGLTGTGKTTLCCAAALSALKHGENVMFIKVYDLRVLLENMSDVDFISYRKKIARCGLLCLDEFGLIKLSDKFTLRLFEIIDERYMKGAIIVTSQLKKNNFKNCLPEGGIRDAFIDRLLRESDKEIVLSGSSWRGMSDEIRGKA